MGPTAETEPPPEFTVLIDDYDQFERGYIMAVLAMRRIAVVGPFTNLACALHATDTPGLRAAVIAPRDRAEPGGLAEELARRDIPYLTLARRAGTVVPPDRPILARPFAAHQVADWVTQTVSSRPYPRSGRPASMPI